MASRTRKNAPSVSAPTVETKAGRLHNATYAADKKNPGKWLIRVAGPNSEKFVGREVPVTTRNGEEHLEKLDRAIWAGIDEQNQDKVCLYTFIAKPREDVEDDLPF